VVSGCILRKMSEVVIGNGSFEYDVVLSKGKDGEEKEAIVVRADNCYMSRGGDLAFYKGAEVFFGLGGGQWVKMQKRESG